MAENSTTGWRSRLKFKGSYRGVQFWWSDVESETGRRTVITEFPGKDTPSAQDMGRRARKITIDMFVVGQDYDAQRDKLRIAVETSGPGQLMHPRWGAMTVVTEGGVKFSETSKELGYAKITTTFVEVGIVPLLQAQATPEATKANVIKAALRLRTASISVFAAAFTIVGAVTSTINAAVSMVQSVATTLNRVRGKIAAALLVIDDMRASILAVADTAADIIKTPITVAESIHALYADVLASINTVTDAFTSLVEYFDGDDESDVGYGSSATGAAGAAGNNVSGVVASAGSVVSSATRTASMLAAITDLGAWGDDLQAPRENTVQQQQAAENQRQMVRTAKIAAVTEASTQAVELKYEHVIQATSIRDALLALIDAMLLDEYLSDELYALLAGLKAALYEHFTSIVGTLPELQDYTPKHAVPALALAYSFYGDCRLEGELLARNPQIRDPSAVAGGESIKVRVDA